jgi:hypothetical protein
MNRLFKSLLPGAAVLLLSGCGDGEGMPSMDIDYRDDLAAGGNDLVEVAPGRDTWCPQGSPSCPCFPNQTCFDGLVCVDGICHGQTPDSGPGPDGIDDLGDAQGDLGDSDASECVAICSEHCGSYHDCDCGNCGDGMVCETNICVPDCSAPSDEPDDRFIDENCDGIDGDIARAVFVAPQQHGGDDFNPGTMDLPKLTIQAALDAAAVDPDKDVVLVSAGEYAGTITLPAGVGLHGGYHKPMGWVRGAEYVATVTADTAQPNGHVVGLFANDIPLGEPSTLDRIVFVVPDNPNPGGSNYGIVAKNADGLAIRNLEVRMGKGGAGLAGSEGGAAGEAGVAGAQGKWGGEYDNHDDCTFSDGAPWGGLGGWNPDGCMYSSAGRGGGSGGAGERWRNDAENGTDGGGTGGGAGGACGVSKAESGGDGGSGQAGELGANGAGGQGFGAFDADGYYRPADGNVVTPATPGSAGSGGGGGGGGAFGYNSRGLVFTYQCFCEGGGGGGGGSGGCGGQAGSAGRGGGGVFGMLFVDCGPVVEDCVVKNAQGGQGGDGQAGGNGGAGGDGGAGAGSDSACDDPIPGNGGKGGQGGKGGRGGHGGGGGGGPSFCYYFVSPAATPDTSRVKDSTCESVLGGAGGGSPGNAGQAGDYGTLDWCGAECVPG